jgi:non-ribosomal peptide synthetase-like protein
MLLSSAGLFFGSLLAGLFVVYLVPRLCHRFLETEKTYVLYGLHYFMQRLISMTSNSRFYNLLFGDSSAIVHYMRFIGWNLNKVEQTGSNFGTNQRHDNPFLCEIGSRTMVSDGLSMINMHMSNSSFRLANARIGEANYLGNDIHFPHGGTRQGSQSCLARGRAPAAHSPQERPQCGDSRPLPPDALVLLFRHDHRWTRRNDKL